MTNAQRICLVIGIVLAASLSLVLYVGPSPGRARFGDPPARCQAAFRAATVVTEDKALVCPRSRVYHTGGWVITVGFDEQDQAEQFVYSKENIPFLNRSPQLSATEQQRLLDEFSDGSRWVADAAGEAGPQWTRADQQAVAGYVTASRWLVIMNRRALARELKALPGNLELAP